MRTRLWLQTPCSDPQVDELSAALGVPRVLARLLCLRGITGAEEAARFLRPSLDHLHDPFLLTGMAAAVARIEAAVARREPIAIHGDYDVDGITSTVMLRRALEMMGGCVSHFLPERLRDGYGLQTPAVERLAAEGVRLLISVDCGIRSQAAARRAQEVGVDLIITDHHEPDAELPAAVAVLNPKRHDCPYPDKHLAGVGVAFKLVQALCTRADRQRWLPSFVKVAALGTLADVVPLVGENRVLAKIGLARLSAGPNNVGLRSLLASAGLAGRAIESSHVAFALAPRINAAGRMSTPDLAARLLLLADETMAAEAGELAERLNEENGRRQQEERAILDDARKVIERDPSIGAHNILIVAGDAWHRGVIGIVASKLVETFHKPAIVLSIEGGVAHGSCRSIPSFDMLAALDGCADVFERYGGHKQAAGLTLDAARLPSLRERLYAHADMALSPDDLRPRLRLDGSLTLPEITPDLVDSLVEMAPFGMGNPRPVFDAPAVEVVSGPRLLKERHLTMTVRQHGRLFRAVAWRSADRLDVYETHRQRLDLAYSVSRTSWSGEPTIELEVADVRPATGASTPSHGG